MSKRTAVRTYPHTYEFSAGFKALLIVGAVALIALGVWGTAESYLNGRTVMAQFAGCALSIVPFIGILVPLVGFALIPPLAGMGARRLQDAGKDGRLVWALILPMAITEIFSLLALLSGPYGALGFLYFIYSIGWLVNLVGLIAFIACVYFWVQDGTPGPNQYGADPKGRTAAA